MKPGDPNPGAPQPPEPPEPPPSPRQELETRLTAWLLGELAPDEVASLQEAIATDPALAELHERLRKTIGLVREAVQSPGDENAAALPGLKLSTERREKLLGSFKVIPPARLQEARKTQRRRFLSLREWGSVATMAAALIVFGGVVISLQLPGGPGSGLGLGFFERARSGGSALASSKEYVDENRAATGDAWPSFRSRMWWASSDGDAKKSPSDLNGSSSHRSGQMLGSDLAPSAGSGPRDEIQVRNGVDIAGSDGRGLVEFRMAEAAPRPATEPRAKLPARLGVQGGSPPTASRRPSAPANAPAPGSGPEGNVYSVKIVGLQDRPAGVAGSPSVPAIDALGAKVEESMPKAGIADTTSTPVTPPPPASPPAEVPRSAFVTSGVNVNPTDANLLSEKAAQLHGEEARRQVVSVNSFDDASRSQGQEQPPTAGGAVASGTGRNRQGEYVGVSHAGEGGAGGGQGGGGAVGDKATIFLPAPMFNEGAVQSQTTPSDPAVRDSFAAFGNQSQGTMIQNRATAGNAEVKVSGGASSYDAYTYHRALTQRSDVDALAQAAPVVDAATGLPVEQRQKTAESLGERFSLADFAKKLSEAADSNDDALRTADKEKQQATGLGRNSRVGGLARIGQLGVEPNAQQAQNNPAAAGTVAPEVTLTGLTDPIGEQKDAVDARFFKRDVGGAVNGVTLTPEPETLRKSVADEIATRANRAQLESLTKSVAPTVPGTNAIFAFEVAQVTEGDAKPNVSGPAEGAAAVNGAADGRQQAGLAGKPLAGPAEVKPANVPPASTPAPVVPELPKLKAAKAESESELSFVAKTPPPEPQPEVNTRDNAFSTFSLNVSDVSFKLAAAALEKGARPDPGSIRSEEFINAFDYHDPEPAPGVPISFAFERARYPFAHNRDLVRFALKTAASGRQPGRPLNLVLLLDNSGSMERADRVQIIHECLRVLAGQLKPEDRISVVAFARTPRLWIDGLPGNQAAELGPRVGGLTPDGGTNLEDALNLAYQTAHRHYLPNGVNRVVLLTDGAANLGDVDPASLQRKVEAHRKQGVALDCFGIGWEGYNDDLLETLSRNGDGRYGFVNTPEAATTEFASQLAGALRVAASDVKVQVEFNPQRVTVYRQIGYAKHQLKKEQFRDNTVDAAEIGAKEAGNALYIVQVNAQGDGPIGTVRVRFRDPGTALYHEHEWIVPFTGAAAPLEQSSPALRLAGAASAFSEWLASSPFAAEVAPDRLLSLLRGVPEAYGSDPRPKKLEWMIRQAK